MNEFDRSEEALFERCLELPTEERELFVKSSCSDDTVLQDKVLSLLKAHEKAGGFMESLPEEDSEEIAKKLKRIAPAEESPGDRIGRYHLLELIGEGSWGTVWMAEQTEDVKRRVALKILKLGLDTKDFLARFEAERQMLAMMDHPNIAHMLDAGATPYGRPYFVMELVRGMPLLEYADRECLSIEERVELFVQICHATQHAHRKGIIHRDLKPSNILVTTMDDEAVPKIIDFGIAKTTQFRLSDKTMFTGLHTFIGTPVYSSPEQLDCSGQEVDNRSDIYSLGALLYVLLCGRTPFDQERLAKLGLDAVRTIVKEKDPPRPSVRFGSLSSEEKADVAGKRKCPPAKMESKLHGDLDWIVMKCLEKDRKRRYETVKILIQDLEAILEKKPVSAAPPSVAYRTKKYIQRKQLSKVVWAAVPAVVFGILALLFYIRSTGDRSIEPGNGGSLAQQRLELEHLRDDGEYEAAFNLARKVEPLLPADYSRDVFWAEFSWSTDIVTDPPGARVYRQMYNAAEEDWEELGLTPLKNIRFPMGVVYRLRFELEGYRTVELLDWAVRGDEFFHEKILNPVRLDAVDSLPETMVRIPGFSQNSIDYGDFFMDRFEVTNSEYERFVQSGGYRKREYWTEAFEKDGREIPWEEGVSDFVDRTGQQGPSTWSGGVYPAGKGNYPVNGVSWYEAAAYARFMDKELPTITHPNRASPYYGRQTGGLIAYNSNFGGEGPRPVGENRAMNSMGVYDLVGNVREWCWNETSDGMRATIGGAWTDSRSRGPIPKFPWDRDATHGFRLIQSFDEEATIAKLREPVTPSVGRDYKNEKPASEAEFQIYKRLYAYDPIPLNAERVESDDFEDWIRERVEFDLPYRERGGAYLYLPKSARPPIKTIIYWPASDAKRWPSVEEADTKAFDFLVRGGRAVVMPIFKDTFDRKDPGLTGIPRSGNRFRNLVIKWVQDASRTIDYVETREDLDSERLGYYGFSWGSMWGPILLAVDDRIDAVVLNVGGLIYFRPLPEADPFNFLSRVYQPFLMLNGRYDPFFPLETSQKPFFELLGTDPAHKQLLLTNTTHIINKDFLVRESLLWFDRYIGPPELH